MNDATYDVVRFEDEYPERAAWLMAWYRTGRHLPGVPEGHVLYFARGGWQLQAGNSTAPAADFTSGLK